MQDEVEVKARELLANAPVTRFIGHDFVPKEAAVRAISAALRKRPVVDDADMARALEAARCGLSPEHVSAIEEAIAAYNPNCGGRTVHFANLGDSEAQFIEDGKNLDCPACGGSGHVGDVRVVDDATRKNAERYEWLRNKAIHTETPEDQETCWAVVGTCAHDACPIDGQDLDEIVDAALLAAYQQDNGGQQG